MINAIFDEHKGVYRINNLDGTFETYTPAQFAELGGAVSVDEDEVETETIEPIEGKEMVLGFYKLLQPIPYSDEDGNQIGEGEVGSVQEVPVELGDAWVEQGLAEKVEQEKKSIIEKIKSAVTK